MTARARRSPVLAATLVLVGLVTAACGSGGASSSSSSSSSSAEGRPATDPDGTAVSDPAASPPAAVQHLEIEASEYRFDLTPPADAPLAPGWTTVTLHNDGAEAHQVMFARLKDGVDLAQLSEAAGDDSSGAAAIAFVDMIGGVSYIGPGQDITAMVDLPEGTVMAMCYVPDGQGVAHALMGMTSVLTVDAAATGTATTTTTTSASGAPTTAPDTPVDGAVEGTIELAADGYQVPADLPTGWYHVVNTDTGTGGEGLHELSILRLGDSVPPEEIDGLMEALAANETPSVALDALGGMGALSPGFEGYLYLDLPPGDYVAVDFMPDPGDPRPHLLDGYYAAFQP